MERYYNIKTNRIFTPVRKYAWIYIPIVAGLGLWYPKLGLSIIPLMLALMITGFLKEDIGVETSVLMVVYLINL